MACDVCGQINSVPFGLLPGAKALCCRCGRDLEIFFDPITTRMQTLVLCALSMCFLIPGLLLPLLNIEKFGMAYKTGILLGDVDLWAGRQYFLAGLIAIFSVFFPLLKLGTILFLCTGGTRIRPTYRRYLHLFIELVGRWGTLDVLLLAVLVAVAKMKNILEISAGPGAIVFSLGVFLSLAASQCFSPRILWTNEAEAADAGTGTEAAAAAGAAEGGKRA